MQRAVSRTDRDTLWIALGLELLSCLGYVAAFQLVFYRAPRRFAARLAWAEMAFGSAVSLGGAGSLAVGAWILSARGVPAGRVAQRSAVMFMLTSAINLIVLIVFGTLLGLGAIAGPHDPLLSWLPAGVGVAVVVFFLLAPRWAEKHAQTRQERSRAQRLLLGLADSIRDTRDLLLRPDWRLAGAMGYLLFDIAVLWVCLDALGAHMAVGPVVLAYQIGYLANVIPVPGGLGVLDSGLVGTLFLYGARATPAAAGVLVYHAIALWVPTLVGTIAFLQLRRTLGEPLVPRPGRP